MNDSYTEIDNLIDNWGDCSLCGFGECCENCNPYSSVNRLKREIKETIRKSRGLPEPIIDYGAWITIKRKDLH